VDDLGLLERMRRGDEAAFAELFARHRGAVFRYAAHMGGDGVADDVVQEVFLALLRQSARYDASRGSLQAYLIGIARRQVLKRAAGRHAAQWIDEEDAGPADIESQTGNPFEDLSRAEIVARVRAAIAGLPPAFREVVVLCELNEMDYAEAAAVIGRPIGTVRSRLHRARALLTTALAAAAPPRVGTYAR